MFAPSRTKMNGALVASPSTLGEDPFGNPYGTTTIGETVPRQKVLARGKDWLAKVRIG